MTACQWRKNEAGELELVGELTRETVPLLWQSRNEWLATTSELTIQLAHLNKVDTAGVAMLLNAAREARAQQCQLQLQGASEQLRAIVKVSGVAELLGLADH